MVSKSRHQIEVSQHANYRYQGEFFRMLTTLNTMAITTKMPMGMFDAKAVVHGQSIQTVREKTDFPPALIIKEVTSTMIQTGIRKYRLFR